MRTMEKSVQKIKLHVVKKMAQRRNAAKKIARRALPKPQASRVEKLRLNN